MIDELNSWDIQGDQMESESGVNRSNADDVRSLDIQGVQLERESGVTRSINDDFFLRIFNEMKWKVKVV